MKSIGLSVLPVLVFSAATALADKPANATAAPPPAAAAPSMPASVMMGFGLPSIREWHVDLNVEGAFGKLFPDTGPHPWTGFGRARVGVMYIRDSLHLSLGATYEYSDRQHATFGLQAEMLSLEMGLWSQAGFLIDTQPHPGFMVSLGWSLFGVEVEGREYDGLGFVPAVYGKLRIPLGIILAGK